MNIITPTLNKTMEKCPKCSTEMVIDEWNGWKWTCFHCDYVGRDATDGEVEILEGKQL